MRAILLLVAIATYTISVLGAPCQLPTDPYPYTRSISTSDTSSAYVYTEFGSVRLVDRQAEQSSSTGTFTPWFTGCFQKTTPVGHLNAGTVVNAAPVFAKSVATQANRTLVGNPNRDTTFYPGGSNGPAGYASSSYSHIDVLQLSVTTVTQNTTIEDFNSPFLGSVISFARDGASMATMYDTETIAIYSPVVGRAKSYFNSASDKDTFVKLPQGPYSFLVSGFSLRNQQLAVSGFELRGATCFPVVQLWTQAGPANGGGAWTKDATVPLRRVLNGQDYANSHECPSSNLPSGALPIKLSDDGLVLIVGVPTMGTVYYDNVAQFTSVNPTPRFVFVANSDATIGGFGSEVDFTDPQGLSFNVFSRKDNSIFGFSRAKWLNVASTPSSSFASTAPASFADNVVPNRRQQRVSGSVHATFLSFASSPSSLFILTEPNQATSDGRSPVFALISTVRGSYYDSDTDSVVLCPVGMFKANPSNEPCSLCPAGTYSDAPGAGACKSCEAAAATEAPFYCPTGATSSLSAEIYAAEPPEYLLYFEAQGAAELFEELLVNTIFTRYSAPMIIFYVLMFSSLAIIGVYWFPWTPPKIKARALEVLLLYRFIALPNEKEARRGVLEKAMKQHMNKFPDGHAGGPAVSPLNSLKNRTGKMHNMASTRTLELAEKADAHEKASAHAQSPSGHQHELPAGLTPEEMSELEDRLELEHHADHIVCAGFFKLILIMFCASAILFSIIFLSSYDWQKVHHHGETPINRYTDESVSALTAATEATARGLEVLALASASISIDLFGFTGAPCTPAAVVSLQVSGCLLLQSTKLCNDTSHWTVEPNTAEDIATTLQTDVCSIVLKIPDQSSFTYPMVFSLSLPANVHATAARYSYLQDAQLAPTTEEEAENDQLNYEIGKTNYRETITHPYTITKSTTGSTLTITDNYLQSPIVRNWNLGTLINRHQDTLESPIHYYEYLFNTISDTSLNPFFPSYPLDQYSRDSSSTSVEFRIVINADTYFRVQTTQRLIQPGVAFLTIVLGLIGIYHMVIFGQEMCELAWFAIKKARDYTQHASSKVAAMATSTIKTLSSLNSARERGDRSSRGSNGGLSDGSPTDAAGAGGKVADSSSTAFVAVNDAESARRSLASPSNGVTGPETPAKDVNRHPLGVESPPPSAGVNNNMQEIEMQSPMSPADGGAPGSDDVQPILSANPSLNRMSSKAPVRLAPVGSSSSPVHAPSSAIAPPNLIAPVRPAPAASHESESDDEAAQ